MLLAPSRQLNSQWEALLACPLQLHPASRPPGPVSERITVMWLLKEKLGTAAILSGDSHEEKENHRPSGIPGNGVSVMSSNHPLWHKVFPFGMQGPQPAGAAMAPRLKGSCSNQSTGAALCKPILQLCLAHAWSAHTHASPPMAEITDGNAGRCKPSSTWGKKKRKKTACRAPSQLEVPAGLGPQGSSGPGQSAGPEPRGGPRHHPHLHGGQRAHVRAAAEDHGPLSPPAHQARPPLCSQTSDYLIIFKLYFIFLVTWKMIR